MLLRRLIQKMQAESTQTTIDELEDVDPNKPVKPVIKNVTGKEAEEVADKPHLIGDPEWDAIEREETNAFREPFDLKRFQTNGGRTT